VFLADLAEAAPGPTKKLVEPLQAFKAGFGSTEALPFPTHSLVAWKRQGAIIQPLPLAVGPHVNVSA